MSYELEPEIRAALERKPKGTEYNKVYPNTFTDLDNKWLTCATIFQALKFGSLKWEKLPKHVQAAVERWLKSPEFH